MVDGKKLPVKDQPVKKDMRTYNIQKIMLGQGDDYTTGCLLHYPYFKENYKLITIDLSKQQAPDVDPKAIQQIIDEGATIFFIIEETKETVLDFSQKTVKVLQILSYELATACSTIYFTLT